VLTAKFFSLEASLSPGALKCTIFPVPYGFLDTKLHTKCPCSHPLHTRDSNHTYSLMIVSTLGQQPPVQTVRSSNA